MAGQRQQRGQAGPPQVGSDHHADTGQPVSYRAGDRGEQQPRQDLGDDKATYLQPGAGELEHQHHQGHGVGYIAPAGDGLGDEQAPVAAVGQHGRQPRGRRAVIGSSSQLPSQAMRQHPPIRTRSRGMGWRAAVRSPRCGRSGRSGGESGSCTRRRGRLAIGGRVLSSSQEGVGDGAAVSVRPPTAYRSSCYSL